MAINTDNFIRSYAAYAMEQQIKYGIPASVTLAQMALESSWGTSALARNDKNFFGIKAGSSWQGRVSRYTDDRPNEAFRSYDHVGQSLEDHSAVLLQSRYLRYCPVNDCTDHSGWLKGIKAGGYATARDYVEQCESIIRKYGLDRFDRLAIQEAQKLGVQVGYMRGKQNKATLPPFKIPLVPLGGAWCMPINISKVRFSDAYGTDRGDHKHGGIDLSTYGKNLPVYATEDNGKVIAVKRNNGAAGNMITVEYNRTDGTRLQCTYMHLSQMDVKEGDAVKAGTPLGYSGNTGRSSGPHLHFETKFYNSQGKLQKYDPAEYLAEVSFRGGFSLASNKSVYDATSRYAFQMASNNSISPTMQTPTVAANQDQMLLADITNSDDPNRWLEHLMQQNGDEEGLSANGGGLFSNLISTLFMNIMVLAQELSQDEYISSVEAQSVQATNETKETKEAAALRRDRESIDAKQLAQKAALNFDAESPEEQQTNVIKRA